ncbi:MAG TPA: Uma2 family endonuclease [Isosphaeraceae bacterium]|nr:Uma2 family endonuclease [Isosphaeraceae bacterium]
MATVPRQRRPRAIDYPTRDGKPMAETDVHREDRTDLIQTLKEYFARARRVYVSGNLLIFYEEGNRRKHIAPDVFVVRGVKKHDRKNYLVWAEGRAPNLVIEITSKSTRREDQKKLVIYRDILRVTEYFIFDPTEDYLDPPLQGFRLVGGDYLPITPIDGRLPSQVLGLRLERDGAKLRLWDPATGQRLPTPQEARAAAEHRAEAADRRAGEQRHRAEAAEAAQRRHAEEIERLRREIESLRRG